MCSRDVPDPDHLQSTHATRLPRRVSLSWEIDATDSPDAAERALDKLLASVADVCTPSRKARQSTLVTVMLLPRAAEHQQQQPLSGKQGKGKATAG
jgi:hypothetical protein